MICPYCSSEITAGEIEKEDGQCPVCGAFIPTGGSLFEEEFENNEMDYDDEFDFNPDDDTWDDEGEIFDDDLMDYDDEFDDDMDFEEFEEEEKDI